MSQGLGLAGAVAEQAGAACSPGALLALQHQADGGVGAQTCTSRAIALVLQMWLLLLLAAAFPAGMRTMAMGQRI